MSAPATQEEISKVDAAAHPPSQKWWEQIALSVLIASS
jgi:hypothetical protein